jgi:hypothetical protein
MARPGASIVTSRSREPAGAQLSRLHYNNLGQDDTHDRLMSLLRAER